MSTVILTDSTCDIPKDLLKQYNISELPLTVHFGSEEYKDRVDITMEEFFEKLTSGSELPTTSQVNPSAFIDFYKQELSKGNNIISIHLSSDLSGTYQSAVIAKQALGDDSRISIVDSRNATLGLGFTVLRAAQLVKKGVDARKILEEIENYKNNIKLFIVVDTLEYLKRGGRLSGAQAMIGTMFNIKPVLTISDGKVVVVDKMRGMKKAFRRLIDLIKENGGCAPGQVIGIANAMCPETAKELKEALIEEFGDVKFIECGVGSVIATHAGPGAYGIVID
jgi:EDD domain protein, DegV family